VCREAEDLQTLLVLQSGMVSDKGEARLARTARVRLRRQADEARHRGSEYAQTQARRKGRR